MSEGIGILAKELPKKIRNGWLITNRRHSCLDTKIWILRLRWGSLFFRRNDWRSKGMWNHGSDGDKEEIKSLDDDDGS
jgi:hypothetical protein